MFEHLKASKTSKHSGNGRSWRNGESVNCQPVLKDWIPAPKPDKKKHDREKGQHGKKGQKGKRDENAESQGWKWKEPRGHLNFNLYGQSMPIFDTKSCGCTSPDLIVEVPEKKHVGALAWVGVGARAWGGWVPLLAKPHFCATSGKDIFTPQICLERRGRGKNKLPKA